MPVYGRDYRTLDHSAEVITGRCDGREASATIARASNGRPGGLTLRYGRLSRQVPSSFLDGGLFGAAYHAAGLGCDGRRILFRARVARADGGAGIGIQVQSVTMDLRTGRLSLSAIRNLSAEEIASELR